MALVKCKECGEDVSTKAKTCPNCGAKAPEKTSLFTWMVGIFSIFIIYSIFNTSTPTGRSSNANAKVDNSTKTQNIKTPENKALKKPSWTTFTSTDKMSGNISVYASSPKTYPSRKMAFPYSNVKSWMAIGCDSKSEWVYLGFDSAPNLANTDTKDGYNLIKTRIRWNDQINNVSLTQDWGAKFIHFQNENVILPKIKASKTALLELQWHGEQPTYFEYSLNGSSKALTEIREMCASNK